MENTMIAKTQTTAFANKELTKATHMIIKATESVGKSLFKIAAVMAYVDEKELYAEDFKNVAEYGEKVFGYKKSVTYNMIRVGREYLDRSTGNSVLMLEDGRDFSFTQLSKMLPLPSAEVAAELVDSEKITPEMTTKQIAEVVKAYNKKDEPETSETEPETETEVNEPEETEPVAVELNTADVMFDTARTAIDQLIEMYKDDEGIAKALDDLKLRLTTVEMMCGMVDGE